MIQRVILAEHEKIAAGSDPGTKRSLTFRTPESTEQLKTDGLINDEEYNNKRKEILGEL
jgi:hypothetical protein